MIQSQQDLETWYKSQDPWDYENTLDDRKRKDILLHELPQRKYKKTLDIGCGHGYVTRELPGKLVVGIDISAKAIKQAQKLGKPKGKSAQSFEYYQADFFKLPSAVTKHSYDLIVITGVLYPQYIGHSHSLCYHLIDQLLAPGGILVSVHIDEWYLSRFPYLRLKEYHYPYRDYTHILEVYSK